MSLRKIAPGPEAEETLKRLNGPGEIKFKQLIAVEMPRVYFPDLPAKQEAESKKVKLDHIQMLTDDEIIATRTSAEEMGNFINKAKKIAFDILEKSDKPFKVRVQFKCTPDGHKVEIAVNKEPDEHKEFLNKLHEELPKLEKLPVKEGTVEFQMFFEVNRQQKKEESKEE
jgi:hypothetical protein